MDFKINDYTKLAPLYILWVLENYSDEKNVLTHEKIIEILEKKGFHMERKAISRNIQLLADTGYDIKGVYPEMDESGNELPVKRGVWLKKELSDESLQLLIDSVIFSKYISPNDTKSIVQKILSLGSLSFQDKNKGLSKVSSVYHNKDSEFFTVLNALQQAISTDKKVALVYRNYKYKKGGFDFSEKKYVVSPYHLALSNGRYYLICFKEGDSSMRHFRVDKIKSAKLTKEVAVPIDLTPMKGIPLGQYLTSHPYLFSGTPENIIMRVQSDQFLHVVDTFGEDFSVLDEDDDYITISVNCNETDAFYWAMQFGQIVEVLSPQSLRNSIRTAVEELSFRYLQRDGDRYAEAIKIGNRDGSLDLSGIKIGAKTKHHELHNLRSLILSDNNITDISFIKNYPNLNQLEIKNNPIIDLSPLKCLKKLRRLKLWNLPITDLSAIENMGIEQLALKLGRDAEYGIIKRLPSLSHLEIPEPDCWSQNIDYDYIEREKISFRYKSSTMPTLRHGASADFPHNIRFICFGLDKKWDGDSATILKLIDQMINKLPKEEKEIVNLLYKDGLLIEEVMQKTGKSLDEIERIKRSANKKLAHESYNKKLAPFVKSVDLNANLSLRDLTFPPQGNGLKTKTPAISRLSSKKQSKKWQSGV